MDNMINQVEPLTATDKNAASQLYKNMQVTAIQQAPITSLYNDNYQYAMLSGISGFRVDPAYPNVVFVHDLNLCVCWGGQPSRRVTRYVTRRVALAIVVVAGVVILTFVISD